MKIIAHMRTDFKEKFGIPRQSGLVNTKGRIVFEPEYARPEALRGLEDFSHIWVIWEFSANKEQNWSPTVRPPRLGGNKRVGVFATRSPFRPNPIGLSCVEIEKIELSSKEGPVIHVKGADLLDGTPIYDIKPYLTYVDSHPEARSGFAQLAPAMNPEVVFECQIPGSMSEETKDIIEGLLKQDPKPAYQGDRDRIYGMTYDGFEVKFRDEETKICVCSVDKVK